MKNLYYTNQFSYDKKTKTFVAEVSNLINPTFTGSQDIILISKKTGNRVGYYFTLADVVAGEIKGWRFEPTIDSIRKIPSCKGTKVLIIND